MKNFRTLEEVFGVKDVLEGEQTFASFLLRVDKHVYTFPREAEMVKGIIIDPGPGEGNDDPKTYLEELKISIYAGEKLIQVLDEYRIEPKYKYIVYDFPNPIPVLRPDYTLKAVFSRPIDTSFVSKAFGLYSDIK